MLIIFAFLMVALYTGLEVFTSITGGNKAFKESVNMIENNLREDVLQHIENTKDLLYYSGEADTSSGGNNP